MSTKSYGEVLYNEYHGEYEIPYSAISENRQTWYETAAQAVIKEFCKRNGKPAAYFIHKEYTPGNWFYNQVGKKYQNDIDVIALFRSPQPKGMMLPDVAQLARVITQAGNPVDAAKAILELLKEGKSERRTDAIG